jgi:hypothetical protein
VDREILAQSGPAEMAGKMDTACVRYQRRYHAHMSLPFVAGDNLMFQLESGYGLFRVLAVEGQGSDSVWHLSTFEELFPDAESAERALLHPDLLHTGHAHLALTDRAFERTPAAKLSNTRSLTRTRPSNLWLSGAERKVSDRSPLQLLVCAEAKTNPQYLPCS